tara:strand:+ start:80 stop:328 length:249 start_codon:yes stop_codon:yes gene_type:complete
MINYTILKNPIYAAIFALITVIIGMKVESYISSTEKQKNEYIKNSLTTAFIVAGVVYLNNMGGKSVIENTGFDKIIPGPPDF